MPKLPLTTKTKVTEKFVTTTGGISTQCYWSSFCQSPSYHYQQLAKDVQPESQCGFKAQKSTTDILSAVRQLQEKFREQKQPFYLAFVGLTKGFGLVNQKPIFTVLAKAGCPSTLHALIQSFYS